MNKFTLPELDYDYAALEPHNWEDVAQRFAKARANQPALLLP